MTAPDGDPGDNSRGMAIFGRLVCSRWSSPLTIRPGATLLMPLEPAWYQVTVDLSPGAVNRVRRVWPTHYMPIPEGP